MTKEFNWAGNFQYSTSNIVYPKTIEEVREVVRQHRKLKVLGTRHSFNDIADSPQNIVSLQKIDPEISIDKNKRTVTVSSGVRYGQLCGLLHQQGLALHNLGSLPHISIAGACVSGTHGSGIKNAILAKAVSALEFVDAEGLVNNLSREKNNDKFFGAVVNLGAIGVVTKLTLDLQASFDVKQNVYENLPIGTLQDNLHSILSTGYSVSLFTDWQTDYINQVWVKTRMNDFSGEKEIAEHLFGAKPAANNLHPIPGMAVENCTEQMGIAGPWHERLPHFRMEFTPSSGEELQSEYFVPLDRAYDAIMAVNSIRQHIAPQLLISELRTIDADSFWMSPCYSRASLAIHFTWKQNWTKVREILPLLEKKLTPFEVRPHWGKLFTLSASQIKAQYKKLADFKQLAEEYDPNGKFRNEYLETYIF